MRSLGNSAIGPRDAFFGTFIDSSNGPTTSSSISSSVDTFVDPFIAAPNDSAIWLIRSAIDALIGALIDSFVDSLVD